MSAIDLNGKCVHEIGSGDIRQLVRWLRKPAEYLLADVSNEMMKLAHNRLAEAEILYHLLPSKRHQQLDLEYYSVDVIFSFYSQEHLYPLPPYLHEMKRVLNPVGTLIRAIPSEGRLAWLEGLLLTSRRWFKKNINIDPGKLFFWEHHNFADQVIAELDRVFQRQFLEHWRLRWLPALYLNLIIHFQNHKCVE